MQAEFVRDMVLASSGLLVRTIGGPSVKPYQPKGLWEAATSGRGVLATYKQDTWRRPLPPGHVHFYKTNGTTTTMILFDASNRDQCEVKRMQTNTPLQALMMMNDPTVLEASRVLSQKLCAEQTSANDKITKAFRLIICRKPEAKELQILQDYYNDQLNLFKQKQLRADTTLQQGEYPMMINWMKIVKQH